MVCSLSVVYIMLIVIIKRIECRYITRINAIYSTTIGVYAFSVPGHGLDYIKTPLRAIICYTLNSHSYHC